MLEIRNIDKTYTPKRGKPVHALNNVSLKFDEKGMVFILGKSGCGKSTLGRTMIRMYDVTGGTLTYKGHDITNAKPSEMKQFQNKMKVFIRAGKRCRPGCVGLRMSGSLGGTTQL